LNLALATNNDDVCTKLKKGKKLEKLLKVSRQEASTLAEFILNYTFSLVENKFDRKSCLSDFSDNNSIYAWDSIIGTMNEYTLVTAVWQLVCQNVDIWSDYLSFFCLPNYLFCPCYGWNGELDIFLDSSLNG
jgi:uncharacterized protein involved in tolerance to divalent cations